MWAYGARSLFAPSALVLAAVLPSNESLWPSIHGAVSPQTMVAEDATSVGAVLPVPNGWHVAVNGKRHSSLPFGGVHTRLGAIPALSLPA